MAEAEVLPLAAPTAARPWPRLPTRPPPHAQLQHRVCWLEEIHAACSSAAGKGQRLAGRGRCRPSRGRGPSHRRVQSRLCRQEVMATDGNGAVAVGGDTRAAFAHIYKALKEELLFYFTEESHQWIDRVCQF